VLSAVVLGGVILVVCGSTGLATDPVTYNGCENVASGVVRLLNNTSLTAPFNACLTPDVIAARQLPAVMTEVGVMWNQQGPPGLKGDTGAQGPQGVTGAQGPQGIAGGQGSQGVKGDMGATGAQGSQGLKGDTGAQGPQGVKGDTGPQGQPGVAGVAGNTTYVSHGSNQAYPTLSADNLVVITMTLPPGSYVVSAQTDLFTANTTKNGTAVCNMRNAGRYFSGTLVTLPKAADTNGTYVSLSNLGWVTVSAADAIVYLFCSDFNARQTAATGISINAVAVTATATNTIPLSS
jgi:hypothetical protein